ncbi:hypothetical protein [Ligilactobacillus ruminis]|uniref:hypothetical protein n=1 Tax=Ligilactobacillus ruminis TaxID=1623 RepID=UPI003B9CA1D2
MKTGTKVKESVLAQACDLCFGRYYFISQPAVSIFGAEREDATFFSIIADNKENFNYRLVEEHSEGNRLSRLDIVLTAGDSRPVVLDLLRESEIEDPDTSSFEYKMLMKESSLIMRWFKRRFKRETSF